jgi:hypothetical protein
MGAVYSPFVVARMSVMLLLMLGCDVSWVDAS